MIIKGGREKVVKKLRKGGWFCVFFLVQLALGEQLKENGVTGLKVGAVEVREKEKAVIFPAYVNLEEGIVEFVLVHKNGKVHESLFFTEVGARELNAALLLIGFTGNHENLESIPDLSSLEGFPRGQIEVMRSGKGEEKEEKWIPIHDFITYKKKSEPQDLSQWAYTGSFFFRDRFMAEVEGDLIAIYTSGSSLFNLVHPERGDDTVWEVRKSHEAAWEYGTAVKMRIRLMGGQKGKR